MDEENKQYISAKLKTIIEPMIAQLILHKPQDPVNFMINWLKQTYDRSEGMLLLPNI